MNRMLILYIFLLLCGTVSAQRTVEWNDLQPLTDDAHRTVYYKKDSKRPLQGKYRIIRGLDVSIRFTTYFLEVFENIWDKIWRN